MTSLQSSMDTPDQPTHSASNTTPLLDEMRRGIVALVDDHELVGRALSMLMDVKQLESIHFDSADALLQTLELRDGHIWLQGKGAKLQLKFAVIDMNMPGMNGVALAHRLRDMAPQLRMVLMTASMPHERRPFGPLPEGVPCLTKPFRLEDLEKIMFQTP
jgi:CheY-like chemotaxis protein